MQYLKDLEKRLLELEAISARLEPGQSHRGEMMTALSAYTNNFLDDMHERKTYVQEEPDWDEVREMFVVGEDPSPFSGILATVEQFIDIPGINPASGGHLGYIPGGGLFPAAIADFMADVTNRYAGIYFANPGAVRLENYLIKWMSDLVGYPSGTLGNLASGGSIANLIALVTARDLAEVRGRDVARQVIYLTQQVHHCVHKAIRIAGLRESVIRNIRMGPDYRMDATHLEQQLNSDLKSGLKPLMVIASAGTTDTGVIDPLDAIADLAEKHRLWFHVDAAYGGFFMLLPDFRDKFSGIERSDSVVVDPHKGLFLPYGLGAVLVKNGEALFSSHHYLANYMQDAYASEREVSPADVSPELTKHFRGLRMWVPLKLFGLSPFKAALEEKILLCQYFYEKVQELGFSVGPYPELSVMIFRYQDRKADPNEINLKIMQFIHREGDVFLSSTSLDGEIWIRLAVLSFRTHLREINRTLGLLKRALEEALPISRKNAVK